ncbi:MAG: NAD(P)-dependent oxidoreductase [Gammaproteobacteria bacterium]|nr:NAD(P)-dependent oxidoreductase [Gammaproteobacteria bacterium]
MAHPTLTVIGLGRMGSALAGCFAAAGVPLTVWNRSPARAFAFDGRAAIGLNAAAACAASDVIVLCLSDYSAGLEVMDEVAAHTELAGKLLVQFTSGSPSDARTMAAWAHMHGLAYLDAAILAYPAGVGSEGAIVFYAGDEAPWERHADTLRLPGGLTRYLGEAVGAAAALDCAALGYYYGATLAMLHGAALCESESLPLTEYFFIAKRLAPLLAGTADNAREMIAREIYAGNECANEVHTAAMRHVQRMSHDNEVEPRLADTVMAAFRKALAAGHGEDEIAALFEVLRRPR